MKNLFKVNCLILVIIGLVVVVLVYYSCFFKIFVGVVLGGDEVVVVYVVFGEYDDFYVFFLGGFSGQVSVYGLFFGCLFKVILVFLQDVEKGYGYNEEIKFMFNIFYGFVFWDDVYYFELLQINGEMDGCWFFINGNNILRVVWMDLIIFEIVEIIEIFNFGGNYFLLFIIENIEYVVVGMCFGVLFL